MEPDISILIITYNRPAETLDLLKSINSQSGLQSHVGEILILDNASDISYQEVSDYLNQHPGLPVQLISHHKNLGVAGGRNFLIKKAAFPLLMVLDDDVVFADETAIEQAAKIFNDPWFHDHNTAVITMNIFYFQNGKRQPTALPHKNYHEYKDKERFLTYYFTGAAHLMKKELFEKTGFYPENFFYGMEEYDLSYRIIEAGYSLAYDDQIKILHKESPLGRVPNRSKLQMMWYNKCVVAYRYLPTKYFFSTAFLWSAEYLRKSGFDLTGMIKTAMRISRILSTIKKERISKKALDYLKTVKARLWY